MVLAMLFFMVSLVQHFVGISDEAKEREAAYQDSLTIAEIEHLDQANIVLKEAIRSQQIRIDELKTKVDNMNYKLNHHIDQ